MENIMARKGYKDSYCPNCNLKMKSGYYQYGKKVWVCDPCGYWTSRRLPKRRIVNGN
jgi:ribosomal protein L37AE/L43A